MRLLPIYTLVLFAGLACRCSVPAYGAAPAKAVDCEELYEDMGLDTVLNREAFRQAVAGYNKIGRKTRPILTLIDFSKPSDQERFYVIDLLSHRVLYKLHVAHGKNSGGRYATSFSNVRDSNKSSLGFYVTANTYSGRNGYSLRLQGLEAGINDRAWERAIVIHGADYCDPQLAADQGRLGRSLGCPALPLDVNEEVIDTIKEGALVYIYAADNGYLARSSVLGNYRREDMAVRTQGAGE